MFLTALKKELRESTGAFSSRTHFFLQQSIFAFLYGVLFPITLAEQWTAIYSVVFLTVFNPVIQGLSFAAYSLAGERERKTIKTYFTWPVSDREIIFSKLLGAALPAYFLSIIIFAVSFITLRFYSDFSGIPGELLRYRAPAVFSIAVSSFFSACASSAAGLLLSCFIKEAKNISVYSRFLTLLFLFAALPLLHGKSLSFSGAFILSAFLFMMTAVFLLLTLKFFSRERIIL